MYNLKYVSFFTILNTLMNQKHLKFFNKINKFERRTQIATKFINVQ